MEFLSKLKSSLKRGFTVLCATVMVLTSGIITGTELTASAVTLHGATYLNEALNQASGGKYREPLETWQSFLDAQSKTDYYKGTPYSSWLYAASPKGDLWQRNEGYSSKIGASGGMNCTGFVWHIISNGLAKGSGQSIATTGTWVPNSNGFNSKGFSRSCWTNGSWYKFVSQYNVHYYEFSTKSEMLSSGVLQKGDIIWCVNASQGSGLAGLSNPDSYHHIGIYMGDGKSDSWWQSGPIYGDANMTGEINSINQIYGKATKNTYVVIPWAEGAKPTFDPYKIAIAKVDAETGKATAQGYASLEGAEFTLKYYSGTSATGTPAKTWIIKTDINGKAKLDSQHLKSGTLFVDSNGNPYLPLGTMTIQETKAPTGYKINSTINTIHIVEKDGKAVIQTEGASTYLQEYTDTVSEQPVRGNLKLEKQNGETGEEFAYIPFLLTNNDTGEKHLLLTDKNGVIDTSLNRNKANILDDYLSSLTFNASNELTLDTDTMMKMVSDTTSQAAGVWFGEGSVSTTGGALLYGTYTLKEIRCLKNTGFHLIDRTFQVTASQTSIDLGTLIDTSTVGVIRGKKVDPDGNDLSGAVIGLFAKDTTEFTIENTYTGMTAISGSDGFFAFKDVPKGEYIVREIAPPDGYLLSDKSYPVTVKVNTDGEEVLLDEDIVNTPTTVELTKVDENGKPLSGAKLEIIGPGGTPVELWTSDGTAHTVTGKLAVGKTYIYYEYVTPDGYVKGEPIYFTIQADGTVTDLDGNPITLNMVNTATVVEISKLDEDENHLVGAVLQILDTDDNVVDEWTTDGKVHTLIGKLKAGTTYTLHEVSAPDGYYLEDDVTFTVGTDGTASVGMTDIATYAGIRKRDDQGSPVVGAVMQILDKDGNIVEEWTTTADEWIHTLNAVLNPDETYTLHEVSAPKGYFTADDITFQVAEKGKLASAITMIDVRQGSLLVGKLSDIQEQPDAGEIIWLPGAVMQVQDLDGNVLDEWITDSKQHTIATTLTPGESYILHEVSAPNGYCVSEDIQFTLNEKGQIVKSDSYESGGIWIRMTDLATKIEIQKTDENNNPLSGAALQILDKDENVVDSWTTDGNVHQIYGKLIAGETYTLREVSAPAGYAKAADQQFTVGTDGKVQNLTLKNIATKVGIDKVDEDSKPLKGAVLQVIDASGTLIDEWTSDGTTHRIDAKLIAGAEYTLHEVSAPNGYVVAADQKFTVNADGSLTSVKMVNVSTKVQISKTTITGDKELPGAQLEVRDLSGNVLESWTSGNEAHMITAKLTAGQTYVLHEAASPNGYVVASDIEFTVNKDATVTKVTMKDDTTKVEINKVTEGGNPLSGAKLQIKDKDGKVVDEWTSDGKAHTLVAKLTANATYTLHEVSAPTGYCVAADQTFIVDATGKMTTVNMTDLTTKVSITKYEITGQNELPGASLELYATEKDKDGNDIKKGDAIDAWTSESAAHEIVGKLTAGATYILHETAAPNGYVVASDVTFAVNADGTVTKVAMKDDTTKVEINKVTEGGEPLSGAKLQIKDKDGKVVDEWTSDGKAHMLTAKLTAGATYTLHEVSAPAGYCAAPDQTFTVPTNGNKLTVSMTDLATDVKVQKLDADDKPLSGAKLQIISTDDAGKETVVDEWTTDGTVHEIKAKLIAGKTYTLRETASPAGYYKAKDITFTVNADGTPNEVSLYNAKTKVSISKYDITGEKEIAGAQLEVRDMEGNVLDSWTSEAKAHLIEGVLVAGQTYVLHESVPADGYVVASDIEFTVTPDGNVTEVKMYDDTTKVEVNKLTEDKKPLSGAVMQIINKSGEVVDEWTTDGTAHVLTAKLTAGVTYTLHEVSAPAGYVVSPDQQFTVDTDGSVTIVSMTDLATVVRIDKVDPDGNPLKGAKLQILDENEKVLDEWTSDGTVHEIKAKLTAGKTYTLRETASPAGYYVSKDSTFTVNLDGTPNAITLYNVKTKVAITKYDITGENPLPGALLQVKDTKGNVLDEWTSGTDAHIIEGVLVSGGTYVLHEETAPDGYVLASDMQFTVNPDGTITTVSMKDDTTKVSITKKDITGENEIAGAALEVRDADGNVIDSWVSDGTAHVISGILVAGATYTLHEVSAPDGYVVASDVEFTVDADGNVTSVTMLDDTTKVSITKYDITGENEIVGASLEVKDADGNIIDAWVSDGTAHQIIGVLAVGQTYTLHEVAAPNGFVVANDVEFQVNADGSVTIVNMYDDTTKVHITKYEITGQNELPGASLELKDSDGNVIDAWISGSEAHEIIGVLTAGEEYTLHEVAAPNGYVVANDVTFTVNTDGSVNVVSMYDDTTKVSITKQDITTGAALAGATLQIIDANENIIEEWISTEEAHMIEAVLTAGETYTLRETAAPNGYVIAEDIPFTVNPDGTVTAVVMQDDVTKVSIGKYDITGEKELAGASMEVKDAQGNVVDAWVSDGTAHEINGVLIAGAEYTLHEVASPDGYVVANDVTFTVNADGSVTLVSMYDYPTVVHISKKDITTGEELPGAYLELYDKDHNLIDAWVSTNEAHIIEAVLIAGEKYTLIETSAPNGYVISEQVEFTVNLDNTITHVDMFDDTTKVQISKKSITGEDELPGASMQLMNKDGKIIDAWISGTEPHLIEGVLIAGQTYVLHEESASNGHVVASDIEFTVSETGEVDYVEMIDDTTKVQLSKKSITGEDELPGASMQLLDKDGNIIDAWTSGTEPHLIEGVLVAGQTYVLHEETAPKGYVVASDIEFTVSMTGEVDYVEMIDDTTKVQISKTDITGENPVSGALLQIKDKDGNIIHEWISGEDVNYLEADLTAGETYILHEESAPNGYVVSQDIEFTVNLDGTVNEVQMKDDTTKVSITKYDITTGEELPGATLQIIDKDGNVIEEWVSGTDAHLITGILTAGETYTLREISAPNGWTVTEDVTFTVDTDGSITHVEMFDKPTSVSIRKVDASGNDISGAVMQLIDKDGNVIEEWTSDGTAHVLTAKLIAGESYTLHEVTAPAGYELAKDQTFTVDENGETTEVVMVDEKTPTVPVATPTTPASSTASSPKTGDAMPVMAVGTGLLASFILMLLARKKKRKGKAA